jgi:hypothetical protein
MALTDYERFVKRVERENETYAAASPAQKRAILAKDALAHAAAGRLQPGTGDYGDAMLIPPGYVGQSVDAKILDETDLRDNMVATEFVCEACALFDPRAARKRFCEAVSRS